ncbi:FtsX-like permease family protein [Candidatus Poribacteria bacterium]|nr:FtsX-like permease family protein [Candidatus Poribacteria bacterium]
MKLFLGFGISISTLKKNKLRTALTVLGTSVGISMIIGILSVGNGLREFALGEMQRAGELDVVKVRLGDWVEKETWDAKATMLTMDDLDAIIRYCPNVKSVSPETERFSVFARTGDKYTISEVAGVSPAYPEAYDWNIKIGRFISRDDMSNSTKVCVIGYKVWDQLFGKGDISGKEITLGNHRLRVIGVMEEKGERINTRGWDRRVFLPITTVQKRFTGKRHIDMIRAQAYSFEVVDQAGAEIRRVLRHTHHGNDWMFEFWTPTRSVEETKQTAAVITTALIAVASIALIVGAVGIMNIMLVSVTERTREIGLRKAVGARRLDILLQFLAEAALIGVIGGVVGILIGAGIGKGMAIGITRILHSSLISKISQGMFEDISWPTSISWKAGLIAFSVAMATGIFFGLYPANKASKLPPADALRHE